MCVRAIPILFGSFGNCWEVKFNQNNLIGIFCINTVT